MSAPDAAPTLGALRQEIDGIDDAVHDLLMRRADIVQRVAGLTHAGKVPFRPGREADVISRLLARHTGPLPRYAIVRWWREVFAAHIGIETAFTIAVCEPGGGQYAAAAREHFGSLTPLRLHPSPAQAIADVSRGFATAAVLPVPVENEPVDAAWWLALLRGDEPGIHIVGRIPFWAARPEGSPTVEAFVVAAAPPDRSRHDRTLVGVTRNGVTRNGITRNGSRDPIALADATAIWRGSEGLLDVAGHLDADDPRLTALGRAVILGCYAVPVGAA